MCGWVFFPSIDPFSVSKHCNVFLWVELRWRQKDSTDRFTNTSYEVCLACFLIITGEIPILLAYVRYSCTVQDRDCYLKRLTLTDETRLADPHTLLLKDSLRLSDSHLTCIVKTNSPCLSSHEDVYIFNFSRQLFLQLHYYSKPQLIATMYIQLHMIKHINCQFVVLHTCTQTLFHTRHSEMHKKSLDAPIITKDNTLLKLFW